MWYEQRHYIIKKAVCIYKILSYEYRNEVQE